VGEGIEADVDDDADGDGARLVARLEEARIKAKRNFDVETFTRLYKEWKEKYD